MSTLDEIKKNWDNNTTASGQHYDHAAMQKIYKSRVNKHLRAAMQYFWASFALQIIVYALLSHVLIKYWSDTETLLYGIGGVLLYIPFTVTLMRKFKRMAIVKPREGHTGVSLYQYVLEQHALLSGFFTFKKRYELVLIPLSAAIGVFLTFKLFVPGGVLQHMSGAAITFAITIASCVAAIVAENKKSFEQPLHQLSEILREFKRDF